jgi:tetratricopeptide (TPR) repeat protein
VILALAALARADLEAANAALLAGDPVAAAEAYADLIDAGHRSADLHYNLGNALYGAGDLSGAVLAWRRAELLNPRDGDVTANLEHARRQLPDRIDPLDTPGLLFWRGMLSPAEQGWGAAVLLGAAGLCGLAWRLRPGFPRPLLPALGVPGLLLAASTAATLHDLETRPGAVVRVQEVEVRSAGAGGVVLFELHAGAEVVVQDAAAGMAQIALPDGRRGWVPGTALARVDPRLEAPRVSSTAEEAP